MLLTALIFGDGMVLQQKKPIFIWGTCEPEACVTLSLDKETVTVYADLDGKWRAKLSPHDVAENLSLKIQSGTDMLVYSDIAVGEVYLAGGQSNMEFQLAFDKNYEKELASCDESGKIRLFDYPEVCYAEQMNDFSYVNEGFWRRNTKSDIGRFTAVGYYFAKHLSKVIDVPIGIISCNWGGTPACAWMNPDYLEGTDGEVWLKDYKEQIKDINIEAFLQEFKKNPINDRTNLLEQPMNVASMKYVMTEEAQQEILKEIEDAAKTSSVPAISYERRPGGLYEHMLMQIAPYSIRGVIWYQGETDGDYYPSVYDTVFTKLIKNWRTLWKENLPFLFVQITPLDTDVLIKMQSGIDGRMTNTGSQHFSDSDKRFYDRKYIQFLQTTGQSDITFIYNTVHKLYLDGMEYNPDGQVNIERRKIFLTYECELKRGQTLTSEKFSNVFTTRDLESVGLSVQELQNKSLTALKEISLTSYDNAKEISALEWEKQVWNRIPIEIDGNEFDQFAIRFAQYHMRIMTPAHDNRMNIGAKGLSGEGYKGHTFWDTEIFLMPYFTFTDPKTARSLEEYRYLSLPGARAKALANGYKGAMYPWESAWLDDGEVTPEYCDVDVVTGLPNKVWSGIIEQHITADVAYGVWQYATVTKDQEFMERYGYEIIMDTAIFWTSRLEMGADEKYHINDVVGPDEFREHVNDNAFTNYMAHWNIQKAIEYYELLKTKQPKLFDKLNQKLHLEDAYPCWKEGCKKLYLPLPTEDNVLPQDDRYLSCKDIDLSKYKAQEHVGKIMRDYNLEQIQHIQVSKQADVLVLFFLLEDQFTPEVKSATWEYYEQRTIHDSSLSLSTHSVLASDMGEVEKAYDLFERAAVIDLGPFMGSSDMGIHAASFGGIWQCVVYGFGGVRMLNGHLRINPVLPRQWSRLLFTLIWQGQKLEVTVTDDSVYVVNLTKTSPVEIEVCGEIHTITDKLETEYEIGGKI